MELEGKIWKSGKHWLIEVTSLDVLTQGHTQEEALSMIKDAIESLVYSYFEGQIKKQFEVTVNRYNKNTIGVFSSENRLLLALSLKRQREKSGITIRQASKRLGSDSPNTYGQYELGKTKISLERYESLLQAINPQKHSLLTIL